MGFKTFHFQAQLDEQARLLAERGMVLVGNNFAEDENLDDSAQDELTRAIVSSETSNILNGLGPGPLDVRIKRLADERDDLMVRKYSLIYISHPGSEWVKSSNSVIIQTYLSNL